jgi:uncharacterized protein (DUF2141 family)
LKKLLILTALLAPTLASAQVPSSPSLGLAEGRCRAGEPGPAFMINVTGIKDRAGTMKAELYPANDADFLQDDNILINQGKTFRRVVVDVPASGNVQLCIRAPSAGTYGLSLLHDRNNDRKFDKGFSGDGVGFGGNPNSLGPSKPRIAIGRVATSGGVTPVTVRMMYRSGLLSFGPIK